MKFCATLFSLGLPLLGLTSPLARPDAEPEASAVPEAHELVKRATEEVYLSNCRRDFDFNSPDDFSEFSYYSNGANSQNGQFPNDRCTTNYGSLTNWEGATRSCKFASSGVTFTSNINANAQSLPNFAYAGTAKNSFHSFKCYKDNKRQLYAGSTATEDFVTCKSIYYCLPA